MSHRSLFLTSLLMLVSAITPLATARVQDSALTEERRVDPNETLNELSWLAGNWSGDMWGGVFSAYYSTPEGGKVLSHSRLTRGGEVAFYEFEVFEVREEIVTLQPYPSGAQATGFEMKSLDPNSKQVVFENPEKDYPTRIVYQRVAEDRLVITLSDPHGGSEKVERFDLKLREDS